MIKSELNILEDKRVDCLSILTNITIKDFLELVNKAYPNNGGIIGQREPLRTKSAIQIRSRMIDDIIAETVLPPIVIGIVANESQFKDAKELESSQFSEYIKSVSDEDISLIDGMQRTTAILEALKIKDISSNYIRVEFWIAKKINSLIYRMLILNTGQVPWNLRRQIEVIYRSFIDEIDKNINDLNLLKVDERGRRSKAGQYQADDIIELYLAFGARKEKIDTKERLADEFTRLDFIEATEKSAFTDYFFSALNLLVKIDKELSRFENPVSKNRFSSGKDLFNSQPARVGFITAIARSIFGRPGNEKNDTERDLIWNRINNNAELLIESLIKYDHEQLGHFLSFETLNEKLSIKTSKVGDFEREFFLKAFEALIEENFKLNSLEASWRAY